MLPTTPLHHMLARELAFPLVCTSGNRSGEPIQFRNDQALAALHGIADLFLVHDRPILRPVDDSVVRAIAGAPTVLRNARGYAPAVFQAPSAASAIATGGHQKAAVAIRSGGHIVLGPHVGDLDTRAARAAFKASLSGLMKLHGIMADRVACDAHPDYASARLAEEQNLPVRRVPHHLAHVLAGCLDNGLTGPVLGVAWDGTGHGSDGTVWGGEFIVVDGDRWRRAAHLMAFALPGGEAASREPLRSACGVLHALGHDTTALPLDPDRGRTFGAMMTRGVNAPMTSSAGRLFDAVAALLGLCLNPSFEGEAAMAVEFAAERASEATALDPIAVSEGSPLVLDWRPTIASLLDLQRTGVRTEALALGFHRALADAIAEIARRTGIADVLLTGGCFQNALLAELARDRIAGAGFAVHLHRRVPPGDGGLAAGQAVFAGRPLTQEIA
jgi:hydrogenase maturation protein HypF